MIAIALGVPIVAAGALGASVDPMIGTIADLAGAGVAGAAITVLKR
jgi:hypothetical protein